jgi:ATP-dependent helicase/nuclease subunit B
VVLSRARRDDSGPAIASRFLLRVQALLGELGDAHREDAAPRLAAALDRAEPAPPYPQPKPMPSAEQRKVSVSVTGIDRLRADPYQFYASSILRLADIDGLDADPSPAWQGEVAHAILERWHKQKRPLAEIAEEELLAMNAHPLVRALWRPRLLKALEWVEETIAADPERVPVKFEEKGKLDWRGVTLKGRIDRLDRMADGTFAVVDYKTGRPPTGAQVQEGFALQLGTLGLMVERGAFGDAGVPTRFEYWSLAKNKDGGFGYIETPILEGRKQKGIAAEDFLPQAKHFLDDALDKWILGSAPFTARLNPDAPGYDTYDQLMRLDEWVRLQEPGE